MTYIEDKDTLADGVHICFSEDTPICKLNALLWYLDREITGYEYEITDENGDDPETYDTDPYFMGYEYTYGRDGSRWPAIYIYFFREPKKIKHYWNSIIHYLAFNDFKIPLMYGIRQRSTEYTDKMHVWGELVKGKRSRFTDFPEIKSLYGVDTSIDADRRLLYRYERYVLDHVHDNDREGDYYEYTGSLGHD